MVTTALGRSDARGVVLAGPAGAGKTRLAQECLARAEASGLPTAQVAASRAAAKLPFGAVAPLLPAAGWRAAGAGPPERADLLRQFAAALGERSGAQRLVLLVDDAHLLDDASATLIYQLATAGTALLIATVRTEERAPDAVLALWKDGLLDRLELGGLDGLAIGDLLAAALGGPVDAGTVAALAARCRGNALYLRELVLGAVAAGTLAADGGLWRLTGPLAPPGRLVELIEARLADLDGEQRALLEAVAVGEPLSVAELTAAGELADAEALECAGLLASGLDGRRLEFSLAHPLHGDVLRGRISALRHRTLSATLAGALAATGARRAGDELRLAVWQLDSGGSSPDLLLRAALAARARFSFPLAERLARAAHSDGAGFGAAVLAAELAGITGRGEDAETELAALAERAGDTDERGRVAVARLENLRLMGRAEAAIAVADAGLAALPAGAWRDGLAARRAAAVLDRHGPTAALAAVAEAGAPGGPTGWARLVQVLALIRTGAFGAAADAAERGLADVAADPLLATPPAVLEVARADALAHAGGLAAAQAISAAAHEAAVAAGWVDAQAFTARQLAQTHLTTGRVSTAARYAREGAALLRKLSRRPLLRDCLQRLASAEALRGNSGAAADALAEIDALELAPSASTGADLLGSRAWTAVAAGDVPTARTLLEQAAAFAGGNDDRLGEANALHDLARLGFTAAVAKRLREVASDLDGGLAAARVTHVGGLAGGDPAALAKASEAFESHGALLLAAEAAADASVAHQRRGDGRAAAAASRRAAGLAAACEGAATPALRSVEARGLLTPGERLVADLAAAGRPNRDIAASLFLSLRTVENRLHRIYAKLGISGRAELAAALAE